MWSGVPLPWIAFEYGGITVQEAMPLSSKDVWVIASQLQSALRCLHEKAQIVHLDCKPQNVFWSKSCERVVLIDSRHGREVRWRPSEIC